LLDFGAVVVLCGPNHLPSGLVLPLASHTEVVWRIDCQLAAKRPIKKRLWRQIVRAKIRHQAENLPADSPARGRLIAMVAEVRSGDPANSEAQAARIYWEHWLGEEPFRRQPRSEEPINGMLNYGYAIVRAAVARALVSAGLFPPIGIHHCNRSNAFCLADDLLEPMRPWVDAVVAGCVQRGQIGVNRDTKRELLTLLHRTVRVGRQSGPLMVSLHRMCASLVRCLEGTEKKLLIPRLVKGEELATDEHR
jgi:CRISPR-associated protein Cas1